MKKLRGRSGSMKVFENAREGTEKLEPEVKAGEGGKTNCTASA